MNNHEFKKEIPTIDKALSEIGGAVRQGRSEQAAQLAQDALDQGLIHPILFNARAIWLEEQSRFKQALADYKRAQALVPRNADILNALGICLIKLGRLQEAVDVLNSSISIRPYHALSHYRKGWALESMGNFKLAQAAYERAILLSPDCAEAFGGLATLEVRKGNNEKAQIYAHRSLELDTKQPSALIAMALLDLSNKDYSQAEKRARALLSNTSLAEHARCVALGVLGDALDGQDRTSEAFAAYAEENAQTFLLNQSRYGENGRVTAPINLLIEYFQSPAAKLWREQGRREPLSQPVREHVFLIGFPRSGTTLLEQILASHPDVVTLEEREILNEPAARYLNDINGLGRLAKLHRNDIAEERDAYWRRVQQYGISIEGKVFVDKLPLNTLKLPLIERLFPSAKILIALRDPRDVNLSCFRRHFEINIATIEFLDIERTAEFYCNVMMLLSVYRRTLDLDFYEHRYEKMLEHFDDSIQAVCKFIGLEWNAEMRNFSRIAKSNEIRSPSAPQVRRELYSEGVGQWRRYAKQLSTVIPMLAPWVEKFGYPPF